MKVVLIYDDGERYAPNVKVKEFDGGQEMIEFINNYNIGEEVIAAYQVCNRIEIETFESVVKYKIKETS